MKDHFYSIEDAIFINDTQNNYFWFLRSQLKVKVALSCPTLCDSMGYTVHGILQARILEWVAFPFSSRSSQPRVWTQTFPSLQADSLPAESQEKPKNTGVGSLSLLQQIFPTQESSLGLLHCRWIIYQLSCQGRPMTWEASIYSWVSYKNLTVWLP